MVYGIGRRDSSETRNGEQIDRVLNENNEQVG